MLCVGETYEQRKELYLDCIKTGRQLARMCSDIIPKHPALKKQFLDCIDDQNEYIKHYMGELLTLERWHNEQTN